MVYFQLFCVKCLDTDRLCMAQYIIEFLVVVKFFIFSFVKPRVCAGASCAGYLIICIDHA